MANCFQWPTMGKSAAQDGIIFAALEEVDAGEAPQVTRCDLSVPHEARSSLLPDVPRILQAYT